MNWGKNSRILFRCYGRVAFEQSPKNDWTHRDARHQDKKKEAKMMRSQQKAKPKWIEIFGTCVFLVYIKRRRKCVDATFIIIAVIKTSTRKKLGKEFVRVNFIALPVSMCQDIVILLPVFTIDASAKRTHTHTGKAQTLLFRLTKFVVR